jgi:membrane associated rhomboid family serine protease
MDARMPTEPSERQSAINAPTVIIVLLAILLAIQIVLSVLPEADFETVLLLFSFIPARFGGEFATQLDWPGGTPADVWTFVTYAFLHGSWMHLGVNAIWLLAFGSAVAWRFGTTRFLSFSAICAAAGAGTHLALHWGDMSPVIGASAALSGHMAAAIRFMFQPGAPLGLFRVGGQAAFRVPAHGLREVLRDRRVVMFLFVWFAINVVSGIGVLAIAGEGETVAWQAHIGGFLAGLILFPLFDPVVSRA